MYQPIIALTCELGAQFLDAFKCKTALNGILEIKTQILGVLNCLVQFPTVHGGPTLGFVDTGLGSCKNRDNLWTNMQHCNLEGTQASKLK